MPVVGSKLIFHVFDVLAEFERSIIRESTRVGLDAACSSAKKEGYQEVLNLNDIAVAKAFGFLYALSAYIRRREGEISWKKTQNTCVTYLKERFCKPYLWHYRLFITDKIYSALDNRNSLWKYRQ